MAGRDVVLQPGRKISYKADGTSEGTAVFFCDKSNAAQVPKIGSVHPDDFSLICHHIDATFENSNRLAVTLHYHGISVEYGEASRDTIEYVGGTDSLPIQLHPKFALMAGKPSAPLNGAFWGNPETSLRTTQDDDAEFLGFTNSSKPEFFGVQYYYSDNPMVNRTYWTKSRPSLTKSMTIVNRIPGFTNPPGVANWLLLDTPYRLAGKIYQVTEQYKGSPAPGWSRKIYPG